MIHYFKILEELIVTSLTPTTSACGQLIVTTVLKRPRYQQGTGNTNLMHTTTCLYIALWGKNWKMMSQVYKKHYCVLYMIIHWFIQVLWGHIHNPWACMAGQECTEWAGERGQCVLLWVTWLVSPPPLNLRVEQFASRSTWRPRVLTHTHVALAERGTLGLARLLPGLPWFSVALV